MIKFSKKDLIFSVVTGFYAGLIASWIFDFLKVDVFDKLRVNIFFHLLGMGNQHVSSAWMMLLVPVCWILGVNFGYFLGIWMPFFNQFGKFAAIGFTNFILGLGILNLFIWQTGISSGVWYSVFVSVAFLVSVFHSYGWNKFWVFGNAPGQDGQASGTGVQFTKFVVVTGIAGLINIAAASFLVDVVHPLGGMTPEAWANVGNIFGSAVALIFSFVGFRLVVFKKNTVASSMN